jgi:ATP-dependent Clp protease ATP-binding subunit ClpC
MKPALASGEIRCIGATTEDEYKKYFKRDGALERRFQRVFVEEPSKSQTIDILKGLKASLEKHHGTQISDAAIEGSVDLATRYILDRKNPDKSIDCLDEACSYHSFAKPGSQVPQSKSPVTYEDVVCLMAEQSGIDKDVIRSTDLDKAKDIETYLKKFVVGQDTAITEISRILRNAYSGVRDPNRPIGSVVLAGRSGCGKTYLAKKMADGLFSSSASLITINLSEFTEKHHQSRLLGSPPGYVGFGDRNQLTDKVLRKPYCLVLLDGIENAHPDIIRIFLRVMSEGFLTDAEGREISFRNAILVMTLGIDLSEGKSKSPIGFTSESVTTDYDKKKTEVIASCQKKFGDDFVTRLDDIIPMIDISKDQMPVVAEFLLKETSSRLASNGIELTYSSLLPAVLLTMCKSGKKDITPKDISDAIRKNIEPMIAESVMDGGTPCTVSLTVSKAKIVAKRSAQQK